MEQVSAGLGRLEDSCPAVWKMSTENLLCVCVPRSG